MTFITSIKLKKPLKIQAKKNDVWVFIDIDELYLKEPVVKHKYLTLRLRTLFLNAIRSLTDQKQKEVIESENENKNLSAKDVKAIISFAQWSELDQIDFYKKCHELFNDVVFTDINYENKFNKSHFNEMSQEDEENLIAEYFANFFINSWMNQLN
jgi:hypothetical protein